MTLEERPFSFDSGGSRVEGLISDGNAPIASVVLHPHPRYGGDMHNHVVAAICEALASLGITTLRFNFRRGPRLGSEGAFEEGVGGAQDARSAIAALRRVAPAKSLLLAGYSFGAMIAASIADDVPPAVGLILVSPPLAHGELPRVARTMPLLAIAGDRDAVVPPAALARLAGANHRVVSAPGVDHSWWLGLDALSVEVRSFAESLIS